MLGAGFGLGKDAALLIRLKTIIITGVQENNCIQLHLGALGKRTFFQVKELAQLTLKVDKMTLSTPENGISLPIDVKETLPAVSKAEHCCLF